MTLQHFHLSPQLCALLTLQTDCVDVTEVLAQVTQFISHAPILRTRFMLFPVSSSPPRTHPNSTLQVSATWSSATCFSTSSRGLTFIPGLTLTFVLHPVSNTQHHLATPSRHHQPFSQAHHSHTPRQKTYNCSSH